MFQLSLMKREGKTAEIGLHNQFEPINKCHFLGKCDNYKANIPPTLEVKEFSSVPWADRIKQKITKTIPPLLQVPRRQTRGMGLIISQSSCSIHLTKCLARNGILPVYAYSENLGPPLLTRSIDFKSMTRDRLQRHIRSLSPVEWKWTETNLHEQSLAPCLHPQSPTFGIETTNKRATSWACEWVKFIIHSIF